MSRLPKRLFALTIGIDGYLDDGTDNLKGATSDADNVVQFLIEKGVAADRVRSLRNEHATRSAIRHELTDLITNRAIEENDPILVYFAGHGNENPAPKEWKNWDSSVQCLVPHDFNEPDGKGGIVHGIPDRTLGMILHGIANAKGNNITVILDCCYSGTGTANIGTLVRCAPPSKMPLPASIDEDLFSGEAVLPIFRHHSIETHILLAACKPEEVAYEFQGKGQFTAALLSALRSLDVSSTTYLELISRLKVLPYQNPQCEGKVDRLLFSNDLRSMKGYFTATLELKSQLQVEAGTIHGITADAVFDIWTGLPAISGPPLYTCNATKVTALRTTLNWRGDLEPPQTFIAKPQKAAKPTLNYHASEEYKTILSPLLDKHQAENLAFRLVETKRELADVSLSTISESCSYEILAPEESDHRCEPKELDLDNVDVWDLMKSIAFYYDRLRHDNLLPLNIKPIGNQAKLFMSMFNVEVYRLEDKYGSMEIVSENLNHPGKGVHIFIDGDDDDSIYGFKITNTSTFNVYPHLFYFNSNELSILPFYKPVNMGNQQVDHPLKAGQFLTVGWGAGGTAPQSFAADEGTVENGFLKLYITQQYVNLDYIEQPAFGEVNDTRVKKSPQKGQWEEFWGAVRIPFVLERKRGNDRDDDDVTRGEDEKQLDPTICLLGTSNAKAPVGMPLTNEQLLHDLASVISNTDELEGVKVHKLSLEDGSRINLIDIPAFEDASLERNAALCQFLIQFFHTNKITSCNALIFAYDVSHSRVEQNDILNFGLVKDLCGDAFYKNIAIFTTNWHRGEPSESFEKRESELRIRRDCCSGLVENGAQMYRCSSDTSTSTLLSALSSQRAIPLAIQTDVQYHLHITKTAIGATLRTRLNKSIEENRKQAQDMKQELEDASLGLDEALLEDEVEAIKADLRTAQKEAKKLMELLNTMGMMTLEDSSNSPQKPLEVILREIDPVPEILGNSQDAAQPFLWCGFLIHLLP
ncbi:hypothetical protein BKA70DRAFT_1197075 [Coprinopsis sp. MPI-PUGE-AT-0042]|nr:hypothetical protein BKA70DRAFT_1197075 [Coprinopsis sp. MPI-PUGE-AT-0042]